MRLTTKALLSISLALTAGPARAQSVSATIDHFCPVVTFSCSNFGGQPKRHGAAAAGLGDVDGDGRPDFALASPHEPIPFTPSSLKSGRVRVLTSGGSVVWLEMESPQQDARYGEAVANGGDLDGNGTSELIVAAPYFDTSGTNNVGKVFVYSLSSPPVVLASAIGAVPQARFGTSVSGGSDVDGDSVPDVLVGAPYDNRNGTNAGEVRVVSGAGGGTTVQSILGAAGSYFGYAVALLDDMDGDGRAESLACAPLFGGIATQQGRATIHSGLSGAVLYTIDGDSAFDEFGRAAARIGDLDGDGKREFVIGEPRAAPGGLFSAGRVLVYRGSDASLLFAIDGFRYNQRLGQSVAGAGDLDADGVPDFVAGGTTDDVFGVDAGVAIAFSGVDGSPLFEMRGDRAGDRFGSCVAEIGDVNGDGFPDVLVGAPTADRYWGDTGSMLGDESGAAYVVSYDRVAAPGRPIDFIYRGIPVGPPAPVGDADGDGIVDVVVAAIAGFQLPELDVALCSGARGTRIASVTYTGTYMFATRVASVGDVNGDGRPDFALGFGYGGSSNGVAFGACVRVLSGADLSELYVRTASAPGGAPGRFVDPLGDVDGDGVGDLFVVHGAAALNTSDVVSGATGALIRSHPDGTSGTPEQSADVGDVDGDDVPDYLVGQPDSGLVYQVGYAGSARLYSGATGALIRTHADAAAPARFGSKVAGLGDVDGDGVPDYAVGAPLDGAFGYRHGSVRAYSGGTGASLWSTAGTIVAPENWFGAGIERTSDYDGDGLDDLLVVRSSGAYATANPTRGIQVLSGATGSVIYLENDGGGAVEVVDADGDSVDEALVVDVLSDGAGARIRTFSPTFGATRYGRPRRPGQALTLAWRSVASSLGSFEVAGASSNATVFLVASSKGSGRPNPPFDVDFFVALEDVVIIPLAADATGQVVLPLDLRLPVAAHLAAQAFEPSSATTGTWSSGLSLRFGP